MDAMTDHAVLATLKRFEKTQERTIRNQGHGTYAGALGITEVYLQQLSTFVEKTLLERTRETERTAGLRRVLRQLDPDVIALCCLQISLHSIAVGDQIRDTCMSLGNAIAGECWAKKLLTHNGKLAAKIERAVKLKHGSVKYRKQAAKSIAAEAGFRMRHWSRELVFVAGNELLGWVLTCLPEVFTLEEGPYETQYLTITPSANEIALRAVDRASVARPVFMPSTVPPRPWTRFNVGGYADDARRTRADVLLRTSEKGTIAETQAAIADGSMQPFLDAVNAVQAVPWKINQRVLGVIRGCIERGIEVGKSLPRPTDVAMPPHEKQWDAMDEGEQRLWKYRAGQVKHKNRVLKSERLLVTEDMQTAEQLAQFERFYTPVNCDWRGRVYPMSHFNFQRDDRVRALFLFADGAPCGTQGLYWLQVHLANCGDFGKISKRPLVERVAWVDQNYRAHQSADVDATEGPVVDEGRQALPLPGCVLRAGGCCRTRPGVCHAPACFLRWELQWPPASLCDDQGSRGDRSQPSAERAAA
jgi:DNA-directed RNA polymerase